VLSLSSFQKEKIKGKDKKGKYEICCVKGKKVKTLVHAHNNRHVAVHAAHMLYRPNLNKSSYTITIYTNLPGRFFIFKNENQKWEMIGLFKLN